MLYTVLKLYSIFLKGLIHKEIFLKLLHNISSKYLSFNLSIYRGYFVIDCISTIPGIINNENFNIYFLKFFRIFHLVRLSHPLQLLLKILFQNLSKKRQSDYTGFASLIFFVIYISHCNACIWLYLGLQSSCPDSDDINCK